MSDDAYKVITDALDAPDMVQIPALVADLMSANFRDYSNTVGRQVEHLQHMVADLEAELGAIRMRINELFSGDFMPTESAIVQAVFYPRKKLIEQARRSRRSSS